MSTLLITIDGPREKVDLAVPGGIPIEELMPVILEMTGSDSGDSASDGWTIARPDGELLPAERTLSDCGVSDGAVLALRPPEGADGAGTTPEDQAPEEPPAEDPATEAPAAGAAPPEPSAEPEPATPEEPSDPGPEPAAITRGAGVAPPPAGSPLERTRRDLPRRLGPLTRVSRATRAVFGNGSASDTGGGRGGIAPRPAVVTVQRPTTPFERVRSEWRSTDYTRRLDASIVAPRLRQCATIAVVSPKGGVGKTTITALLGSLLAHTRRDRIVAVDTNPDYGSLGPTLTPDHEVFVDDLLDLLDHPELTVTQLDANLGRGPDGLLVLPAPTDPQRMARLDRRSYVRVIEYLQTKAGVLMLDCGTGLQEPAAQAAIMTADQLVLVSDAEPATATLVTQASKLLLKSGVPLMVVVNKFSRRGARLDLDELAKLVPRAAGMTVVEANARAASRVAAGDFTWEDPAGPWDVTLRELASALLSQWQGLGLTVGDQPGRGPVGQS